MPLVNPIVYNQTNLQSWKKELISIEPQIIENVRLIEEQRMLIRPYQLQLESVNALISITHSQLATLKMSVTQDMIHHMYSHHRTYRNQGTNGILHVVGDFMRNASLAKLHSELERLQEQRDKIRSHLQPYEILINKAEANLNQFNLRRDWLKKHSSAAELFLRTLHENSLELVNELTRKITKEFTDYEDKHLTGLSPQVRISLLAFRFGLKEILFSQGGFAPDYLNERHRMSYLRLCGFLWDRYHRVKLENKASQFENILGGLIESTHILENGDLPDHMQTSGSARFWFEENKRSTPEYFAIQAEDLPGIEEHILKKGLTSLYPNSSAQPSKLHGHIVRAALLIGEEVCRKKQKNEEIDFHFYGRAVRVLGEILVNPLDKHAVKRLGEITENVSGNTSVGKNVLGGLLVVLGVVLIGASVAGFVTTFGLSALLSGWGVALGLSMVQAKLVVTVASSVAGATGLGLTFFTGPDTIKAAQRQGLSQELMDIKEEVRTYERYQHPI